MPISKKDIDKEIMFNKIMPSGTTSKKLAEANAIKESLHAEITPPEKVTPDEPLVLNSTTVQDVENQKVKKGGKGKQVKKAAKPVFDDKAADKENLETEKEDIAEKIGEEAGEEPIKDNEEKSTNVDKAGEEKKIEEAVVEGQTQKTVMINIREKMVMARIDEAITKFNCCNCYLCKQDIIMSTLNSLKPKYIVAELSDIPKLLEKENYSEVTSAILKSILHVKANPRHEK